MRRFKATILIALAASACAGSEAESEPGIDPVAVGAVAVARAHGAPVGLAQRAVVLDELAQAHVRFDQTVDGLRVFEGQAIAHVELATGAVLSVTDALRPVAALDTRPTVSRDDAAAVARREARVVSDTDAQTELMVFVSREDGATHLAWRVNVVVDDPRAEPVDWVAFIDAHGGGVLLSYDNLHTGKPGGGGGGGGGGGATGTGVGAVGSAQTLYSGTVAVNAEVMSDGKYSLTDLDRGAMWVTNMAGKQVGAGTLFVDADNAWGNGTNADPQSAGGDAAFGAAMTWDYFATVHGRSGIFGDGKGTLSRVHYGRRYNNAFWSDSCKCMTYGDGDGSWMTPLASLDIAGHEMTHGVTSATADLTYSGEPGGLNESISDIFGAMVEFHAAAAGAATTADWKIGEDVYTPTIAGDAFRYLDHPTADGRSIDHYSAYTAGMDVHYSSGLANNVFYLLAAGGANDTSGIAVEAIGPDAAAAIFYRALTVYMTAGTDFAGARAATMSAAADLYGAGSVEELRVGDAWHACGVD